MRLDPLNESCATGQCPGIFASDRDTFVVQGVLLDADGAGISTAPGEALVEVPREILLAAIRALALDE